MTPLQQFIIAILGTILVNIPAIIIVLRRLENMRHHMNSRLDELIAAEKKNSFSEGRAFGKSEDDGLKK